MLLLLAACLGSGAEPAEAKVFFSRSEALELAFPGADRIEERHLVLDERQARAVEERARERLESRLVTVYTGIGDGRVLGHAFIDVHTVRTLPEAFLVVLSPSGEVRSLRVLAFYEPEEYLPTKRWLDQFERRALEETLRVGGTIHGIAGATLSARAVTGGVRRSLALFEVMVRPRGEPGGGAGRAAPTESPPVAGPGAPSGGGR